MIISRDRGPVGEWIFERDLVERLDWPTLERALEACSKATAILSKRELLEPTSAQLSVWLLGGVPYAMSKRSEKPPVTVSLAQGSQLAEVWSTCRSIFEQETLYPVWIEISGRGKIFTNGSATNVLEDVVWLWGSTLEMFRLSVRTQCDVWMPYDLKGEPQSDLHRLNADRLAGALQEIQAATGFGLEEGVRSDYAVMKGYHLDNMRYPDGSVVDVY